MNGTTKWIKRSYAIPVELSKSVWCEACRLRLEAGELGLDFYGLRQKLVDLGVE